MLVFMVHYSFRVNMLNLKGIMVCNQTTISPLCISVPLW